MERDRNELDFLFKDSMTGHSSSVHTQIHKGVRLNFTYKTLKSEPRNFLCIVDILVGTLLIA